MNMKSITAFALASFALAGVACSQGTESQSTEVQTVAAEDGASGTFNLSLPSTTATQNEASGSLNLNLGGDTGKTRLIGSGAFGGGDFGSDPAVDLNLGLEEDGEIAALEAATAGETAAQDDGIIRLTPRK
jgi:outer membrane murein-binding lipoprotein Lpp